LDDRKHILLMTATITPQNAPNLSRTDPAERLKDYQQALSYYLEFIGKPLAGIVFVENSNSDVSTLRELVAARGLTDKVEFVCNYGEQRYSEMGRPYGEFKLLEHAMDAAAMIRDAGAAAVVWKITGRYIVKNLRSVIAKAPAAFDVYIDMKNRPVRWMDMRLMAWTIAGYEKVFRGVADTLGKRIDEMVMRDFLPERVAKDVASGEVRLVQRFRNEPLVDGIRGFDNQNFSAGAHLVKFYVRSAGRVVAPWLWI
jgi:hypothetical protein